MAKRIERARVEAGRFELPKKLAFLQTEKVDYVAITDRGGEYSVELGARALSKLAKARTELKALKAQIKTAATLASQALDAETAAHAQTQAALAKAERRIKALEKNAASAAPTSAKPGPQPESQAKPKTAVKVASKRPKKLVESTLEATPVAQEPIPEAKRTPVAEAAEMAAGTEPASSAGT
jgi:hypothetical protein